MRSSSCRATALSAALVPSRDGDERLQRDEAAGAVRVRRGEHRGRARAARQRCDQARRQPGERGVADVVGRIAHGLLQVPASRVRARARPAGRGHAQPRRAATRCAGLSARPADARPPRPGRAARRCRPLPPRAPRGPRRAASPRRSAARRAARRRHHRQCRRIASARTLCARSSTAPRTMSRDQGPWPPAAATDRLQPDALVAVARGLPQQPQSPASAAAPR